MAYIPTNWKDGDIISAEKMNKLEQGVAEGGGGGVLLVNVTNSSDGGGSTPVVNSASPMLNEALGSSTFTADKTYAEVDAAVKAGKMVYLVYHGNYMPLSLFDSENDSIIYVFEKINNYKHLKYMGGYTPNELQFKEYPYFTTIFATYNGGSYDRVHPLHGDDVTMFYIYDMLNNDGVKVDLVVQGKGTADLILPLVGIDNDYAYFSNNSLTLKVDADGAVTEVSTNPSQY